MSTRDAVQVVRRVNASPEIVFGYLTSSEKWSLWQGVETTIDARPGGAYTMRAPNGGVARGEVVEVVDNERIAFTWGWDGHPNVPPGSTTVTIELHPDGPGTIVTLTHSGLPRTEMGLHQRGWNHYVDRLAGVSEGRGIGADTGIGDD